MKLFKRKSIPREEQGIVNTTPEQTVRAFLNAFQLRDVEAALSVVDKSVRVEIFPLDVREGGFDDIRTALTDIVTAFPDLHLVIKDAIETGSVVTAELKVEGTQAADYAGAVNQEKHLDVDQAWRFTVDGDHIVGIHVYWCQNQLYRRLAVKRLDQIAIV
ncbi:nuclear transport factor 2 family protein [Amycolatopsis thermoflava]|uniref:nuclear transport factor 2 family protein n=1 Tax=Amycolatopsis thermoflava TaxID=84480 RepID=UPI003D763E9B